MAGGGGAPPALIRGVLLDLNLLLRVSNGGLPVFRPSGGAAAAVNATGNQSRGKYVHVCLRLHLTILQPVNPSIPTALSEEEQLERRIRMEIVWSGGAAAAAAAASTGTESQQSPSYNDDNTSLVGGLAQALGVRGFDGQQGRPLLDPRDPLRSAMASAGAPPPPRSSPGGPSTPPPLSSRARGGSTGDVRAKYMEKLKARTAMGKVAGRADAVDDEAARRTAARRVVEATELRGTCM